VDHGRTRRRKLNGVGDMNSQNVAVWDEHSGTAFPYVDHDDPSLGDGSPDLNTGLHPALLTSYRFTEERKREREGFEGIVGSGAVLMEVLDLVRTVAPADSTVLIQGETGTGKELIAQAVHNISPRCNRRFVKVNCASIPLDLLESELFGHEKGAFTGAIALRIGRFEMAHQGTVFLDEIGDIPLALQPKLLRVLQEQEFERLGSGHTHKVDVRVVAATHRNLMEMSARNEFRSDLYYRLNVFPISLPPLRERREDIPALVTHFVKIFGRRMGKQIDEIPSATMASLVSYSWPGNIRELQNLIERSVILTRGNTLCPPLENLRRTPQFELSRPLATLWDSERELISRTLKQTNGIIDGPRGAAAQLGVKRTTLYSRMQKLGISRTKVLDD
jgi:formate hydrogenlyase transcriptional activator